MNITHFYHIYAHGKWKEPLSEHISALKKSELIHNIDNINIGIVGSSKNINQVKKFMDNLQVNYNLVAKAHAGWEQVTMNKLREFAHNNDGWIFYAHTKGSSDPSPINTAWRKSMTYYTVIKWREATSYLDTCDTVGTHWVTGPQDGKTFWGGTFWWATTDYLKTLPPIGMENRHRAEDWIGINKTAKVHDMNPGWPSFNLFKTDW